MTTVPDVSAASITPVVVRLKLSLLRNGLRQSGGGGPRTSPPSSSPCSSRRSSCSA